MASTKGPKEKPSPKSVIASPKAKPAKKTPAPKAAKAGKNSLVIVESPAKQRTISRFLKQGYVVTSSYGHVRDLPEKKLGVDEKKDFAPTYALLARTKKLLPDLKKLAKDAETIYLATDHDREGESIAWHLAQILEAEPAKFRRITFHEITPTAILEALRQPREVDENLVHAQQARRVIDRLVGYKLSPLLWKKIKRGLSAGRVQSVAVRLLVERDREITEFKSEPFWTLIATLSKPDSPPLFDARLTHWKGLKVEETLTFPLFSEEYRVKASVFRAAEDAAVVEAAVKAGPYKVVRVERKEVRRRPTPPFITSTLQQAGSQRLGFAAERTMRIAQSLYEGVDVGEEEPAGLITYMRTDSTAVAKAAQVEAREFLQGAYGDAYLPETAPIYVGKVKGAQEAHEAIRPTSAKRTPAALRKWLTPEQLKLYTLIWRRFLASQMKEAVFDTVAADVSAGEGLFHATGRTLKFDGFLRVLQEEVPEEGAVEEPEEEDDEKEGRLPDLQVGDALDLSALANDEHHTSPPAHYNEASIIRALERHGIGRPSTYAPTIKTIIDRGYIRRGIKDRRLTPSKLGILVINQLIKHFADQMSLSYTAKVELQLDEVAEGRDRWQDVVRAFYAPFAKALKLAAETMEDCRIAPQKSDEMCPICAEPMLIRESRFGMYLSCSLFPKCKGKVQLDPEGKKILPEVTDKICDRCAKPMVIRTGRKGRFLACSGYPACKNTFSIDAEGNIVEGSRPIVTERKCNKCTSAMWMRQGKRGHFLACSAFPRCRNLKPISREDAETLRQEAIKKDPRLALIPTSAPAPAPAPGVVGPADGSTP